MKKLVILGAGQMGRALVPLINPNSLELIAFGDNMASGDLDGVPVMSVSEAASLNPDIMIAAVASDERCAELEAQARWEGYRGEVLRLSELTSCFDLRAASFALLARRLAQRKVPGCIAELGVFRGDTARLLNALFPDKTLYLFDTFEGFDPRDIEKEEAYGCSRAKKGDFSDTSKQAVLNRLPFPDRAVVREGYFPGTASGLESETYALVSLDADLYAPLLAGLEYFYPRLSPGAMILMHDYHNERFRGARQAVADYEKRHHRLILVPLCDLHGSAVIVRP